MKKSLKKSSDCIICDNTGKRTVRTYAARSKHANPNGDKYTEYQVKCFCINKGV